MKTTVYLVSKIMAVDFLFNCHPNLLYLVAFWALYITLALHAKPAPVKA
jgi:hypothetical protein